MGFHLCVHWCNCTGSAPNQVISDKICSKSKNVVEFCRSDTFMSQHFIVSVIPVASNEVVKRSYTLSQFTSWKDCCVCGMLGFILFIQDKAELK